MAASDVGEGVEGEAEVFGEEVAAESLVYAVKDALQMFVGTGEGFVVAGGGNDDVVLGDGRDVCGLEDGSFELVDVRAELGADGDWVMGVGCWVLRKFIIEKIAILIYLILYDYQFFISCSFKNFLKF